jgi:predicted GH43/DUF377 family glycosyl hydrolase
MRFLDLQLSSLARIFFPTIFLTLSATYEAEPMDLPSGALTVNLGNPLIRNGPQAFDYWKTGPRGVLKDGAIYKMWYEAVGTDSITRVGYATSPDGLTWTKQGVVTWPSQAWERDETSPNAVLFEDGVYKMWYHGGGYTVSGVRDGDTNIGYATSADGINWDKYPANPVLSVGAADSFDDLQVAEPRVLKIDTSYRMYYTGQNSSTRQKALGMATSVDGIAWTKYSANPLITASRWGGWGGAFIFDNGTWHLWHSAFDDVSGINYKYSSDGIEWTDGPSNPVLRPSGDFNRADAQAAGDSVSGYLDGTTYRIMYTGFNSNFQGTGRLEAVCQATINAVASTPPLELLCGAARRCRQSRGRTISLSLWASSSAPM